MRSYPLGHLYLNVMCYCNTMLPVVYADHLHTPPSHHLHTTFTPPSHTPFTPPSHTTFTSPSHHLHTTFTHHLHTHRYARLSTEILTQGIPVLTLQIFENPTTVDSLHAFVEQDVTDPILVSFYVKIMSKLLTQHSQKVAIVVLMVVVEVVVVVLLLVVVVVVVVLEMDVVEWLFIT